MTGVDPLELRKAFGSYLTGVTVVTTCDADGRPVGFTANSFSSVSLDPPMLLVCPSRSLSSFEVFEQCRYFAVNILAEGQQDISNTFAAFKGDRFDRVDWHQDENGCPLFEGASAHFSCRTAQVVPAGDHVVLLGEVVDFRSSGARGLGYMGGQYFSLGLERRAAGAVSGPAGQARAGAIVEFDDRVLLNDTPDGLCPPQHQPGGFAQARSALAQWLSNRGLSVELGNAYSIFDDLSTDTRHVFFLARAANADTCGLGRYVPIADLPGRTYVTGAHASMLRRFALEHQTRSFGLYLGDESAGELLNYNER